MEQVLIAASFFGTLAALFVYDLITWMASFIVWITGRKEGRANDA
jgi:hypothetical protein